MFQAFHVDYTGDAACSDDCTWTGTTSLALAPTVKVAEHEGLVDEWYKGRREPSTLHYSSRASRLQWVERHKQHEVLCKFFSLAFSSFSLLLSSGSLLLPPCRCPGRAPWPRSWCRSPSRSRHQLCRTNRLGSSSCWQAQC